MGLRMNKLPYAAINGIRVVSFVAIAAPLHRVREPVRAPTFNPLPTSNFLAVELKLDQQSLKPRIVQSGGDLPQRQVDHPLGGHPADGTNDEYPIQKRDMSLDSLAAMSDNPAIRLPAAPALA